MRRRIDGTPVSEHRGAAEDSETLRVSHAETHGDTKHTHPAKQLSRRTQIEDRSEKTSRTNKLKDKTLRDGWREGRRMYLDPIYWIMDNSGLRLLEEDRRRRREE